MSVPKERVNILMVDDQPAKLLGYETILAGLGENLIRASSGNEALAQLLEKDIAVVLVDVCMPDLDGFELASMIRNHPRFQKTAIILVSGVMVEDSDRLKGYDSGAVDYVSVPIIPEILRAKVSVFADLYRKTRELELLNRELEQRVVERTAEIEAARCEAERANRAKDEFLATLSHELRTPLNAITGWSHMLRMNMLDEAARVRAAEAIERNAQRQARLIADILDVSRIDAGKLQLDVEPVVPRTIVEAAVDTVRPAAAERGVQVEVDLGTEVELIMADPVRLQQVVWNLLSNAIKFAPAGGHVRVSMRSRPEEVELAIQDDGPGIAPDVLPFVFDRFRQGDSSTTRSHHGLGLGLAIARHLVEMHGGRIVAENVREGTGARFTVTLPRGDGAREAAQAEGRSDLGTAISGAPSLHGIRVLVVDDEPDGRDVVSSALTLCHAETRTAESVREALDVMDRWTPTVLVADIEMPVEDGYELMRRVRQLPEDRGGGTPAIALTAHASAADRMRILTTGFQRHVAKPVQPGELAAIIASLARGPRPRADSGRIGKPRVAGEELGSTGR